MFRMLPNLIVDKVPVDELTREMSCRICKSAYKCSMLFGTFIHSFRIIIYSDENYSK